MTITEALKIAKGAPLEGTPFVVSLACGFTPLHLRTFLNAHLLQLLPDRPVRVETGLYGDLAGTIENASRESFDAVAIALEWPDLDPRLGYRSAGLWRTGTAADIVEQSRAVLTRISAAIAALPPGTRVGLSLPTAPLPPLFHTPGWRSSKEQLLLERDLLDFACHLAGDGRTAIINMTQLAEQSTPAARFDAKSELLTGLPYTVQHAGALAGFLARALLPASPKKGVITDLDDTLWSGILGEVGADGVSWDLTNHTQLHAIYQKLLSLLSEEGVLIGVASKNDPANVTQAFARPDLLLRPERVFPMEVHWNAKSASVQRILETWNVAADSVIFVDDSPMELAEVQAVHPGIQCMLFPKNDPQAGYAMLRQLRDLCGRERISNDDAIRLDSIRQGAAFRDLARDGSNIESFLEQVNGVVVLDTTMASNPRVLELVNKTNQFNLNGTRYTPSDWERATSRPEALVLAIRYEDKFGPLGTISVMQGEVAGSVLHIRTWVLSCRAFARRIEHQTLKTAFELSGAHTIEFDFCPTPKNGPTQDLFEALLGERPSAPVSLTRAQFDERCPPMYSEVRVLRGDRVNG